MWLELKPHPTNLLKIMLGMRYQVDMLNMMSSINQKYIENNQMITNKLVKVSLRKVNMIISLWISIGLMHMRYVYLLINS